MNRVQFYAQQIDQLMAERSEQLKKRKRRQIVIAVLAAICLPVNVSAFIYYSLELLEAQEPLAAASNSILLAFQLISAVIWLFNVWLLYRNLSYLVKNSREHKKIMEGWMAVKKQREWYMNQDRNKILQNGLNGTLNRDE